MKCVWLTQISWIQTVLYGDHRFQLVIHLVITPIYMHAQTIQQIHLHTDMIYTLYISDSRTEIHQPGMCTYVYISSSTLYIITNEFQQEPGVSELNTSWWPLTHYHHQASIECTLSSWGHVSCYSSAHYLCDYVGFRANLTIVYRQSHSE